MHVETMSEETPPGTVRESVTDDDLYEALREYWHPVAYVSEVIDGGPLAVTLLEEPLVLARIDGQVSAFRDICVHRGTALSLGSVDENGLRCGYHGWCYDGEGRCTKIPARPELKIPSRARLTVARPSGTTAPRSWWRTIPVLAGASHDKLRLGERGNLATGHVHILGVRDNRWHRWVHNRYTRHHPDHHSTRTSSPRWSGQ